MKQIRAVNRSIVALKRQVRLAIKELNHEAAKLVAKGKYDASSALIESARRMREFASHVEALRSKWAAARSTQTTTASGDKTALWEYYSFFARAIGEFGGSATRSQLVDWVSTSAAHQLKQGDLVRDSQGLPNWQRSMGRIRRAMIQEGYLEKGRGLNWTLTKLGRDLGKRPRKADGQETVRTGI